MWFWWYMFVCDLLIPMLLIIAGRMMWKHCPQKINRIYGYRTKRSMKSMETWKFAHDYCGRLWWKTGIVMLIVSALVHFPFIDSSKGVIGIVGLILCTVQILVLIGTIFMTEHALKNMRNPWESIVLSDYENHMSLDSVGQLQALNQMMKRQLNQYDIHSAMILGIAGGNGLEHVDKEKLNKVYGVDINAEYLNATEKRYEELAGTLECLCIDLINEMEKLPKADMLIANLLIEYIGYECFQKVVRIISPRYISCIIQINVDTSFVSESPYIHVFDGLESIHYQITEQELQNSMNGIDYQLIQKLEYQLPNGKKLVQLDFRK